MEEEFNNSGLSSQNIAEMDGKYLTFWTDQQLFGVPIADVVQIVGIQQITVIPDFPAYAKGIINLRGTIIPVIDIRLRFRKPETQYNERTCIIVSNIHENAVGLIVDAVDEVTDIDDSSISLPPKMSSKDQHASFLTGIGKLEQKIVLLLDISKILSENEFELLAQETAAI
ncbi:MAG TPA: chemotaxis protein CheW [Peptococcaceae bacterium]|nr:chemotaxis protein CheW [Peptococcaceae bacterium]